MKLLIAGKIYHHRKRKNMTQEELATMIGVSSQAVSGWERNCGYPDITLLPGIAHALGITIDELMGNDELSVSEDIKAFYDRFWDVDSNEKLRMAVEYYHKYPDNYGIASILIFAIELCDVATEPEYKALLCEAAERIIEGSTSNRIRYDAISAMYRLCDEDEAKRWFDMCPQNYSSISVEIFEEKLWKRGDNDKALEVFYITNLRIINHLIGRNARYIGNSERIIEHAGYLCRLIRTFGENGEVPDGWIGKYAYFKILYAVGLFGAEKTEEGFAAFSEAMEAYKKLFCLPNGLPLDLGCKALFGGIKKIQRRLEGKFDEFINADGTEIDFPEGYYLTQNPSFLYILLTDPSHKNHWKWFDNVRDDPRFKEAVAWTKEEVDKFTKRRDKYLESHKEAE